MEYLHSIDKLDEAANELAILVNEDKDVSERGKTSFQASFNLLLHYIFSCGPNCVT